MRIFNIDITRKGISPVVQVTEHDAMSRFFTLILRNGNADYEPPENPSYSVWYKTKDSTGWYDTIEEPDNGTHPAVVASGNMFTIEIAEAATTSCGELALMITGDDGYQLTVTGIITQSADIPGYDSSEVENYYNVYITRMQENASRAENAAATAIEYGATIEVDEAAQQLNITHTDNTGDVQTWVTEAEAWAVGQRDGVDVPSTDETYHNNAKYYAQAAAQSAASLTVDTELSSTSTNPVQNKVIDATVTELKNDFNATYTFVGMPIATEISYGSSDFTTGIYKTADIGSIPTFSTSSSSRHLKIPVTDNLHSIRAHLTMDNVAYACPIVYVNSSMEVTGYVTASNRVWNDYLIMSDDIPVGTTEILVQAYLSASQTEDDLSAVKVITTPAESGLSVDVASLQNEINGSTTTNTVTYAHSDSVTGIYKQNGDLSTQGDRFVIPAAGLATLTATTRQSNLTYAWPIVYMDENMNILGYVAAPEINAWNNYSIVSESIPSGTAYVLVQRYGGDDSVDSMVATAIYATTIPSVDDRLNALEANNKIIDVIIFMGQSNMAGRGITSETWPETAMAVDSGAGYEFRAISDPLMLHSIDETVRAFGYAENASEKINDGTGKTGGPVPAFINAYYVATGVPVVGVSASEGGTTISQWQPGGARLTDAIDRLNGAVTFCTAKGYFIRHKYMVWAQGESDGDNNTSAEAYKAGFEAMLSSMMDAGIEKCFLIRIGNHNVSGSTRYQTIMNVQTEMAQTNPNIVMVTTDLAGMRDRGLMKDEFHYYQAAYNEFGAYAGANAGMYAALGKEPTMYDPLYADLYYSHKN